MNDTITLGNILGSLSVITVFIGFMMNARKVRRENDADARARTDELKAEIGKHNDTVEKRLTTLETKSADFMPRAEIEGKIEHERRNRVSASESATQALNRHSDKITALEVCVGKVEQKQDGMAADMVELKNMLREMARDMKEGFKEVAERKAA